MNKVMWFFQDETGAVAAQTLCRENEEEQAIDEMSLQVPAGKYTLGFVRVDGSRYVNSFKQVVSHSYGCSSPHLSR